MKLSIGGKNAFASATRSANAPIAIGIGLLGLMVIGGGIWLWYGHSGDQNIDEVPEETLDDLILQIADLDEQYEKDGIMSQTAYQHLRQDLLSRAKNLK